ncbi:flagellar hook protein [Buchnera aphidicola (Melanaphis sacchari)]|uniref:Flagellar hook-associated protein 1 n=1 Tax=Buchnera aphidicola (Melanaphis sacchari) TaxID=2173854 RepID=A0A2U8DF68_9GAMM|nr:flagellar hook protein [Buchnera aphidicola]AWH90448.1 flagellar hook protein [Buchnera aphidicola (Melanaphis sacchari)]
MSSILNSIINNMHAIQILIDDTSNKIMYPKHKRITTEKILIKNQIDESNLNPGVQIQKIYDEYNDFIQEEKRKTSEKVENEETKIEQYLKLEHLFGEKSNIFSSLINQLFSSIKENIINKNENVFNEEIENNLNKIIISLKEFDNKLNDLEKSTKELIAEKIKKANILINKIYDINIDIRYFPIKQLPNRIESYIEKRDHLIDELNNIIGIKVTKDHDEFKVFLNSGMCIIDDYKKYNLITLTSSLDDKYISVGCWDDENKLKKIEHMILSGSLGALFEFRNGDLENSRNKIGQLTINFADSINRYHTIGYDSLGNPGKQVFNISDPKIISSSTNELHPSVSIKWVNTSNAQDSNYVVLSENNHWTITRLKDHKIINPEIYQDNDNTFITFDGIELRFRTKNSTEGNIYMIKPYFNTLSELRLLIVKNNPLALSSTNDLSQINKNNAIIIHNLNKDELVDKTETLFQSYLRFLKYLSYKCNDLEEKVPFERNMIKILDNKKLSTSDDNIDENYQKLSYEQKCYLANAKILKLAENIFNEIVECYS